MLVIATAIITWRKRAIHGMMALHWEVLTKDGHFGAIEMAACMDLVRQGKSGFACWMLVSSPDPVLD